MGESSVYTPEVVGQIVYLTGKCRDAFRDLSRKRVIYEILEAERVRDKSLEELNNYLGDKGLAEIAVSK